MTVGRLGELLEVESADLAGSGGYVDLVGEERGETPSPAQRLMESRLVPRIYERWWRPALGRLAKGIRGPSMDDELRIAVELLELRPGSRVLDVACGPGNFTRRFSAEVGPEGLVVGVDLSETMLRRAVEGTSADNVVYVRAPIERLPVRAGGADAVACFAALHLFDDPWQGLDTMIEALKPGGRIAILTSLAPGIVPRPVTTLIGAITGMEIFPDGELTRFFTRRGFAITASRSHAAMQIVGARAPS